MKPEHVAVGILEERLVTDARVEDVSLELDAAGLEARSRAACTSSTRRAIGWLFGRNSTPNASDCIRAIVRLPVSNSAPGISPQRLANGRPSTSP